MIVDTHHVPIKVFSSLKIKFIDGIRFLDPESLCFDNFLTLLGVILMTSDNFDSFRRTTSTHIPPIWVFCLSHMKSYARKWFLGHENLCFDTFFVSLGVKIAILYKLTVFGIMAASDERHNGHLWKLYYRNHSRRYQICFLPFTSFHLMYYTTI